MSLETMTKLSSTTVGAGGTNSVTFSNIPQNYTDLKILISSRTSISNVQGFFGIQLNSTTSSSFRTLYTTGSAAGSDSGTKVYGYASGGSSTASAFGNAEIYIPSYTNNLQKQVCIDSVSETAATGINANLMSGIFSSVVNPVTSITVFATDSSINSANVLSQYTTVTLYGVKNAAKTAGNSIKATGGAISFDGTYVYHAFNTTGSFVPTQPLTADILQIAGGGGGGANNGGGGGGAGGLLYYGNQTLTANATYTCTVGAGGAAGVTGSAGGQGSSTQFYNFTSSNGGGGGGSEGSLVATGGSGGSGGGAGSSGSTAYSGGSATPAGQGNAGGGSATDGSGRAGGGGGGAGAAGGAGFKSGGPNYSGGDGGNGSSAYSSWGLATGTGQFANGLYYYAGGGAGQSAFYVSGAAGLGGGGGRLQNGQPNTGGGGGGDNYKGGGTFTSSTGGSGVIIIRYKG